jgi:hypothetical protein
MEMLQKKLNLLQLNIPGQTMHTCEIDMDGLTVDVVAV